MAETIEAVYKLQDKMSKDMNKILRSMDQFNKEAEENDKNAKTVGDSISKMGKKVAVAAAGYLTFRAAQRKVLDLSRESIEAFNRQEIATARLESIAYNVANATETEVEALKKLADQYQQTSTFGDEVIESGQSQILSFGVTAEQAGMLTGSLADLLAANKGLNATQEDAITTANMLGKAINGQAGELAQAGILLNEHQKELIRTGDRATRVATIIEVMNDNYGGLAQTLAQTETGQIELLNNEITDLQEEIGQKLLPVQKEYTKLLKEMFQSIADNKNTIGALAIQFASAARHVGTLAEGMGNFIAQLTGADKIGAVMNAVADPKKLEIIQNEAEALKELYDTRATDEAIAAQKRFIATIAGSQGDYASFVNTIGLESQYIDDVISKLNDYSEKNKEVSDIQKAQAKEKKEAAESEADQLKRQKAEMKAYTDLTNEMGKEAEEVFKRKRMMFKAEHRAFKELQDNMYDEAQQAYEARKRLEEEEKEAQVQKIEDYKTYASAVNDIFRSITAFRMASINKQEAREIKAIEASTKSESQKAAAISAIQKSAEKEKQKVALADWKRQFAMIHVNAGSATMKAWAEQGYPAAIPLTIAIGAQQTAASAIALANKPRFATGGIVGGFSTGRQGADNREIVAGDREAIITVSQQRRFLDFMERPQSVQNINSNNRPISISVTAMDSRGVREAVLDALYEAQERNEIDTSRISIGVN